MHRCRDVVLRLALLQPNVMFTLFDRCRRAPLLRLLKVRNDVPTGSWNFHLVCDRIHPVCCDPPFLRLSAPQGRSLHGGVAEFLGHPPELAPAVRPVPGAAFAVSGFAALPPHGHPNISMQCVYVNGRWVKAGPLAR